jgi:hypothetical protein
MNIAILKAVTGMERRLFMGLLESRPERSWPSGGYKEVNGRVE